MNRCYQKIICLLLAGLTLALSGCGLLSEEELGEISEDAARQQPVRQDIGQELQASYKADHVFSLNSMRGEPFNPYTTDNLWNRVVSMLVYETLVKTDDNFDVQPGLITDWHSDDGMTWTFRVDTSRSFHDGGVMTPGDAVVCIEQARGGQYAQRFSHVTGVYGESEDAFVVTLDEPNWRFPALLNIPCVEAGAFYADMPPGTGPYKFNRTGTKLELNEAHPLAGEMPLDSIRLKRYLEPEDILQAFEDSLLDLVVNNPMDMSSLGYASTNLTKYVDTTNMHYLGYNMTSKLFSQPSFRALMTYAVDRDTIVSTSMQGAAVAATLPIHPNSALYPKTIARSLEYSENDLTVSLQNTGARDVDYDGVLDAGPVRAEITFLVCTDSAVKVAAARQIATQLRNAGFAVIMAEMEYNDYIKALEEGAYDIYYAEVKICDDWDIRPLVAAEGELNYGGVRDPNLEGYIRTFLASNGDSLTTDAEMLYSYMAQFAPITTICFERTEVLYHRGVITTIDPTQDNIFNDMQDWVVDLS